mgnify:CR=1
MYSILKIVNLGDKNSTMKRKNKLIKTFLYIFAVLLFSKLFIIPLSAEENVDFLSAVDGEEKRAKWGSEEFKQGLIKEMSSANVALFIEPHLDTI